MKASKDSRMTDIRLALTGMHTPEALRWHDHALWFADVFRNRVCRADGSSGYDLVAQFEDRPVGLGFAPDGSLLVALMNSRQIVRIDIRMNTSGYADLAEYPGTRLNDMVVDGQGRIYVGNVFSRRDLHEGGHSDGVLLITPDRTITSFGQGQLKRPNGLAVTANGKTLIAADTALNRLIAFAIADDGSLSPGRVFADTGGASPDGICSDADKGVWFASPNKGAAVRVEADGKVTQQIGFLPAWCTSVALGGEARTTLYTATWTVNGDDPTADSTRGEIVPTEVDIPGAGWP
jgi:sugar lactone lactonase YvrE